MTNLAVAASLHKLEGLLDHVEQADLEQAWLGQQGVVLAGLPL